MSEAGRARCAGLRARSIARTAGSTPLLRRIAATRKRATRPRRKTRPHLATPRLALPAPYRPSIPAKSAARDRSCRRIAAVERASRLREPVRETGRRAGDPPVLVAAVERARTALGW